eukprot:4947595-Amphidinium_carterae.1
MALLRQTGELHGCSGPVIESPGGEVMRVVQTYPHLGRTTPASMALTWHMRTQNAKAKKVMQSMRCSTHPNRSSLSLRARLFRIYVLPHLTQSLESSLTPTSAEHKRFERSFFCHLRDGLRLKIATEDDVKVTNEDLLAVARLPPWEILCHARRLNFVRTALLCDNHLIKALNAAALESDQPGWWQGVCEALGVLQATTSELHSLPHPTKDTIRQWIPTIV